MMKKLVNFRLILFIAISFCVGIVSAYFLICSKTFWVVFTFTLFICLNGLFVFPFSAKEKRKSSVLFALLFIAIFCLGGMSFVFTVKNYQSADLGNHYYEVTGKIVEVKDTAYGKKYIIKNADVEGNLSGRLTNKIALFVNGDSSYDVGDVIRFSDYLDDKTIFYEGRFNSYDIVDRVKYTASVSAEDVTYLGNKRNLFENINVGIRENLKKGLGTNQFSIAYALLTGNSEQIDPDTLDSYRSAGVAHIFAVSGLHVGFVAMVLNFLFDKFRINRRLKAVIITAVLILFSWVCGFSASSLRATVMSSVLLFSAIGGYKYDKYTSVATAALIVLIISPVQLLCAGFQLSFIIVVGMFLLIKPIYKLLKFLPTKLAHSLSSVVSAQLVAIPASLAIFGEFSTIAVVVNLVFVPIVGTVFIALMVIVGLSAIVGAHKILFFLPNQALKILNTLITAFDYEVFMFGGITMGGFIVFYYVTVVVASGFINLKSLARLSVSIVTALTFLIGTVVYTDYQSKRTKMYVCGSETVCATVISSPDGNIMIISDFSKTIYTNRLNRIADSVGRDLSAVIVLSGFNYDLQSIASQLYTVFDTEAIYYYGDRDEDVELAVMKSFPKMTVDNLESQERFSVGGTNFEYLIDGNAVEIDVSSRKLLIFSAFKKGGVDYSGISENYDFAVYCDLVESLSVSTKAENKISYRRNFALADAESGGNAIVLIA